MSEDHKIAVCTFRVQSGAETEFEALLQRHWQTLHGLGLTTERPTQTYKGMEKGGGRVYVEIFEWLSTEASARAHELPEVLAIWEPMGRFVEQRGERPAMDFIHVSELQL
jgi:hypothetical protein